MTQIPQIAPFARDRQVADRFASLAEFSIRLLQWKATDRPSVIKPQRWLKSELYKQTPLGGGAKTPTLSEAIRMAADGYWSLQSPISSRSRLGKTSRSLSGRGSCICFGVSPIRFRWSCETAAGSL